MCTRLGRLAWQRETRGPDYRASFGYRAGSITESFTSSIRDKSKLTYRDVQQRWVSEELERHSWGD